MIFYLKDFFSKCDRNIKTYFILTFKNVASGYILCHATNPQFSAKSGSPKVFYKKGVLRNFEKFTGKYLWQNLFFNKVVGLKKETLSQVFSSELCDAFKSTFFYGTLPVPAS